ncbi:MAG: hypothetical protein JSW05_13145 [Candidatus Thorarchaeota archaeon]|nr:MAG: hypothetical protein JSW05_13145 [Candidatus Thorarchaeota archaeon]
MIRSRKCEPIPGKTIHKVLVLGADIALQTGFLNHASQGTAAFQLYSTLGVGIGVTRSALEDGCQAVLQLWSLPLVERFNGITQTFMKGHRGAILVLRPDETEIIEQLFSLLPDHSRERLMVIIVGTDSSVERALADISEVLGKAPTVADTANVQDCIEFFAQSLSEDGGSRTCLPVVTLLDASECPPQEPILDSTSMPLSSREEIAYIKEMAESLGAPCTSTHCIIELDEGTVKVELSTGEIRLEPVICQHCLKSCVRTPRLCIVGMDSGWSYEDIGPRAMLTMAKIFGLVTDDLPEHVRTQLHRASRCHRIELPHVEGRSEETMERLKRLGYVKRGRRWTLLEAAGRRVLQGRLSPADCDAIAREFLRTQEMTSAR